jgi:hypothetical protein
MVDQPWVNRREYYSLKMSSRELKKRIRSIERLSRKDWDKVISDMIEKRISPRSRSRRKSRNVSRIRNQSRTKPKKSKRKRRKTKSKRRK